MPVPVLVPTLTCALACGRQFTEATFHESESWGTWDYWHSEQCREHYTDPDGTLLFTCLRCREEAVERFLGVPIAEQRARRERRWARRLQYLSESELAEQ